MSNHGHNPKPIIPIDEPRNTILCEHALVISLPASIETRLQPFMEQNEFDGEWAVVEGIDGAALEPNRKLKPGTYGCLLSHLKALRHAKQNKYPCCLFLEDDIRFAHDFNEKMKAAMLELPKSWGGLWLGGLDQKRPSAYSPLLNKLGSTWGAYGYVLRDTVYDLFIHLLNQKEKECDNYYKSEQENINAYKTVEPLVLHNTTQSDRGNINALFRTKPNVF